MQNLNKEDKPLLCDGQIKYLNMIERVIERMGQNSFSLKEWTMTLTIAICTLSGTSGKHEYFVIALVPTFVFWLLDSYYLQKERKYRALYDDALLKYKNVSFSMDISKIKGKNTHYLLCVFSITESVFYLSVGLSVVIIFCLIK